MKPCSKLVKIIALLASLAAVVAVRAQEAEHPLSITTKAVPPRAADLSAVGDNIWQDGVGSGFLRSAQDVTVEFGAAAGMATFGSRQAHDLVLQSASYGHMLSGVVGKDHWYRGNVEARLELFSGMQFRPSVDTDGWLVGVTPHLRYNFATGTPWVPFIDGGAGVTAMGIGPPDVSGTFEFNLQATAGVHYFLRPDLAITGDIRYIHFSCAGTHQPNLGINNVAFMLGVTWFFGK